jgi:hypothetical protein
MSDVIHSLIINEILKVDYSKVSIFQKDRYLESVFSKSCIIWRFDLYWFVLKAISQTKFIELLGKF